MAFFFAARSARKKPRDLGQDRIVEAFRERLRLEDLRRREMAQFDRLADLHEYERAAG